MKGLAAKEHMGTLGVMEMFYILTGAVVMWVYTFVKTQIYT